jgi:phospholipase C
MDAGHTWGSYSDDPAFSGALKWSIGDPGTHTEKDLLDALDHGTLPNVAFVDGVDSKTDDHPPGDLQVGEAWLHQIYDHTVRSPQWNRTALVWTYDEGGGFADHVPPPDGCAPSLDSKDRPFFERGPRVPFVVVSPYAKPHYVSHVVQDHTAITRFIEAVFDLPALTRRDANSSALLELFDFASPPALLTPPDAPASGTNGCH